MENMYVRKEEKKNVRRIELKLGLFSLMLYLVSLERCERERKKSAKNTRVPSFDE